MVSVVFLIQLVNSSNFLFVRLRYVSKQHWILFSEIEAPDGLPTTLLELNPSVAAVPAQTLVTKKHEGK